MSVVGFVCRAGRAKMIIAILLTGCELQHDCRSSIEIVPGSHHLEGPIHSYAAEQAHAAYGGRAWPMSCSPRSLSLNDDSSSSVKVRPNRPGCGGSDP
eukprot:COSAG02_NODE_16160_length_1108_cov_1.528246_2_plen_97_part_01